MGDSTTSSTVKPKPRQHIVVVGGSLTGLVVSIPLLRQGHDVTILERSPTPLLHNQGAGIVAGGETQAFYSKHDITKTPIAVTSPIRLYLDKQGNVIDEEDSVQRMTSWDLLYHLGRANFDQVDSAYLEGGKAPAKLEGQGEGRYEYGRTVTAVKDVGDKVLITYEEIRNDGAASTAGVKEGTIEADFLIAADGPSSRLRGMLIPGIGERIYAGYSIFRGTMPETELSAEAAAVFVEKFAFFHGPGTQILAYLIPGPDGSIEKGKRLVNWGWYWNFEDNTPERRELMTDIDGVHHRYTVPGNMAPAVLEQARQRARDKLPPQFAELMIKTGHPFVQAITDLPPPDNMQVKDMLNGKAVLAGDAFCGFRPHTAASTSQAAFHALLLDQVFAGKMAWSEYEEEVTKFGTHWYRRGRMLGQRSQYGEHPLSGDRVAMAPNEKVKREELWMR